MTSPAIQANVPSVAARRRAEYYVSPAPLPVEPQRIRNTQDTFEGSRARRRGDVHLRVPYVSQFTLPRPRVACFRAARAMASRAGARDLGPGQAIWLRWQRSPAAARSYIDSQLDSGKPVIVGVNRPGGSNLNMDRRTDHWVVITGRGTDAQGRTYYTFHDPGTRGGQDSNSRNRFYVDERTGALYRPSGDGAGIQRLRYDLTAVRRNAGSNLRNA